MWLGITLCVLLLLDAWRLRARARSLPVLPQDDGAHQSADEHTDGKSADDEGATYLAVAAPGALLEPELVRAASAFAARAKLETLDLIPGELRAQDALACLQLAEPARLQDDPFAPLRTAGHALLLTRDVRDRASHTASLQGASVDDARESPLAFVRFAAEARRCAARSTGMAVAPTCRAVRRDGRTRALLFRELWGGTAAFALAVPPLLYGLLGLACALEPWAGLAAVAVFHLQPLAVLLGTPLRCADLALYVPLRLFFDLTAWASVALTPSEVAEQRRRAVAAQRPGYDDLIARGVAPFFEEPAEHCPMCGDDALTKVLTTNDRIQHKPGLFTLMRCTSCHHIFQNPRLSIPGLNYYYRDFYDGLGEAGTEAIFAYSRAPYLARARMLAGLTLPRRWLDVGAGHGHFCLMAREVWPSATFDGLDLSDGVDLAVRRKWMDHGIRGFFPEKAAELRHAYDVVSMSHYLEHTRDPAAELAAAATVLAPGGHLLIEVPDPSSRLGRILRGYWVPWFQPQHQHFVSVERMATLLREHGFEPVRWHRGEAHQRVDFALAALLWLGARSPNPDLPWRPPSSPRRRLRHALVWALGFPWVLLSYALDRGLGPLFARPGWSNTYRVLARRAGETGSKEG